MVSREKREEGGGSVSAGPADKLIVDARHASSTGQPT